MATPAMAYQQGVAGNDLTIGRTLDTSDDMARLMLVHSYAGSKTVKVYADNMGVPRLTRPRSRQVPSRPWVLVTSVSTETNDMFVPLKLVGTYYRAGDGTGGNELTATKWSQRTRSPSRCIPTLSGVDVVSHVVLLGVNTVETPTGLPTYIIRWLT